MTILGFFLSPEQITYAEEPLKDPARALGTYGVKDGDVVVLRQTDRRPMPPPPAFPGETFEFIPHYIGFYLLSRPVTIVKLEKHSKSTDLHQAAHFPHIMTSTCKKVSVCVCLCYNSNTRLNRLLYDQSPLTFHHIKGQSP